MSFSFVFLFYGVHTLLFLLNVPHLARVRVRLSQSPRLGVPGINRVFKKEIAQHPIPVSRGELPHFNVEAATVHVGGALNGFCVTHNQTFPA
jgi:hypothetical protein